MLFIKKAIFRRQSCILSVRFPYTPSSYILAPLRVSSQYVLPDNLELLQTALYKSGHGPAKINSSSRHLLFMNTAVLRMSSFIIAHPEWFYKTHCAIARETNPAQTVLPLVTVKTDNDYSSELVRRINTELYSLENSKKHSPKQDSSDVIISTSVKNPEPPGKLDSGIHTEEECNNAEGLNCMIKSEIPVNNQKECFELKNFEGGDVKEKSDSGYIGEVRSINVYS